MAPKTRTPAAKSKAPGPGDISVNLDLALTPAQAAVYGDTAHRYVVWAKGRRCGGTRGAANYLIERMVEHPGTKVLWVDTVQGNLDRYVDRYFMPPLKLAMNTLDVEYNIQKKILQIGESYIDFRSAEKPENIEGFSYDVIVCNEAGLIFKSNRYLWENAIRPMAMDYKANVFFIGTPKGKRDRDGTPALFWELWQKSEVDPNWARYQSSSYDNPLLDKEEIKAFENDTPSIIRRQEIYAEFVDEGQDELFIESWWQYTNYLPPVQEIAQKLLSLDTSYGKSEVSDYTAGTIWIQTNSGWIIADAWQERLDFPKLINKCKHEMAKWNLDRVLIEDKASGQSLIQMLQRTTIPVVPFKSDKDKITRATAITPYIEQGRVQLLRGPWNRALIDQCSSFPLGEYDDMVDTVSQALIYMRAPLDTMFSQPIVARAVVRDSSNFRTYDTFLTTNSSRQSIRREIGAYQ